MYIVSKCNVKLVPFIISLVWHFNYTVLSQTLVRHKKNLYRSVDKSWILPSIGGLAVIEQSAWKQSQTSKEEAKSAMLIIKIKFVKDNILCFSCEAFNLLILYEWHHINQYKSEMDLLFYFKITYNSLVTLVTYKNFILPFIFKQSTFIFVQMFFHRLKFDSI